MKMKVYGKKLVCRLLVVVMVISLFPAISAVGYESQTEDGWKYNWLSNGNIVIIGYVGEETNVTIPSEIEGTRVTAIGDWQYFNKPITSITIPNSIEDISIYWFSGFHKSENWHKLESINVDSNNKNYSSENGVLYTKDKLELLLYPQGKNGSRFVIPNGVKKIGYFAFTNCVQLTRVSIPKGVMEISTCAFKGCKSLKDITIPNSVALIGANVFRDCAQLTRITIPNSVTEISTCAFMGCSSLTDISIPNSVTKISCDAFEYCTSLKRVVIPKSVTSIGSNAFYHCKKLKVVKFMGKKPKFFPGNPWEQNPAVFEPVFNDTHKELIIYYPKKYKKSWSRYTYYRKKPYCSVKKIKINKKKITLKKKKKRQLRYIITPKSATNKVVRWKSSNPKVATVSKKGIVKARKKGKCTITVITKDGNKKARCKIIVK
ncbi:MAG: leucine-rich repeat protein [Eubacterium sp.]|nr:leucine-rich repeat protein [Eubacterium sp.]